METRTTWRGIQFELLMEEKPICVLGKGWVRPVKIIKAEAELSELIAMPLWTERVIAVYPGTFPENKKIGLLLDKPMWGR